jgi:hypothetical protein
MLRLCTPSLSEWIYALSVCDPDGVLTGGTANARHFHWFLPKETICSSAVGDRRFPHFFAVAGHVALQSSPLSRRQLRKGHTHRRPGGIKP